MRITIWEECKGSLEFASFVGVARIQILAGHDLLPEVLTSNKSKEGPLLSAMY